jgi:IclR family transcriptional regulator, acetate operon repressor
VSEKSETVRAIDRAIDVLECFATGRRALSIGEIEKRVRLSRPTLYRILSTLMLRGFVRKDGDPPRYRLDIGIGRLADAWTNSLDIVRLAMPLLQGLLERYDETVALYLRKDNTRLCVAEVPSRQALSYSRGLGYSGSLVRGASGLAILAFLDADHAAQIIAQEHDSGRAQTLRRKLIDIRRGGYALSGGDFIAGAQAIASPVFDRHGAAIGSLGLFGPSVRFPAKRVLDCARAVKHSASSLSSLLGHRLA